MDQKNIEKINHLLNEEKWTRATIKNYSVSNFKELDSFIEEIADEETKNEIIKITEEHLTHTKNSIIALYISGIISLSKHLLDDSNMMQLISVFSDNGKWNVVEFICERILGFGENKFALKALAECYENENEEEKKIEAWERLIKIDFEETDIVKNLAEKYENDGNREKAIEYYKKAIHRYAGKKLFSNVKDIWTKLIKYSPDDLDFFYYFLKKVKKTITPEKMIQLLEELYQSYKNKGDWDSAIDILKEIILLDPKKHEIRNEIIYCYKQKYGDHSQFDEYIKISNLSQNWRNIMDAINDFEKHISFDAGNFVYHKTWGIGKIAEIKGENIIIDFVNKKNHSMSIKMAVNALSILDKDHIRVIKCTHNKQELRKKVKEDIPWILRTIIKSFKNEADLKRIKAELVPSILTPGEWTSWSAKAKKILKTDPEFGNISDKEDFYEARKNPISYEEKTFNKFKSETNFFDRLKTLQEFTEENETSSDSEFFPEMSAYFKKYLKSYNTVDEKVISSFLFLKKLTAKKTYLKSDTSLTFQQLFSEIEDIGAVFSKIADSEIKKDFLENVKSSIPQWADIFGALFPDYLSRYIPDTLTAAGHEKKVKEVFSDIFENYKDHKDAFVWICRYGEEYPCFNEIGSEEEKILVKMIHLLDITYRKIASKKNLNKNRKINRQIFNYLFKEKKLENFIMGADEETVIRMFSLIDGIESLDPNLKMDIRKKIEKKFPGIKLTGIQVLETVSRSGILVTEEGLEKKQKELKYILEVEIPQNSKEIGIAIAMGDLRENAEYKAGKEKQELLNSTVAKLKEDIEKAQVFDIGNLNLDKISFGTKVTLYNMDTEKNDIFTILGPWESSPEENIISYIAPLGDKLLGAEKEEELHFTINERDYNYKVVSIEKSDLL